MNVPADIKEIFFQTLYGHKTVLEFEQWLYTDQRLETIMTSEDYLDLISYGYKGDSVKYGLYKLLEKHIDKGEYEQWRLLKLLQKALQRDSDLPEILMTFYALYCSGYSFLDKLGLGYGLAVKVPYSQADSWEGLSAKQQGDLLDSFYPGINEEIRKVIDWVQNGEIVPKSKQNDHNHYEFTDNRAPREDKTKRVPRSRG